MPRIALRARARRSAVVVVLGISLVASLATSLALSESAQAGAESVITPATGVPAGFTDTYLFTLSNPTAIAFTPDGRMLITTDAGMLRVVENGSLLTRPALDLSSKICSGGERGMMGVAVDPNFSSNNYIYVFWTFNKYGQCPVGTDQTPVNRVSRYQLGGTSRVVAGSAKVLVDNMPSPATNHNSGDLHFGANELLYISVGDGGCTIGDPNACEGANTNSRRLDIPNGKILRVTRNGKVPSSNPFVSATGARRCTAPSGVEPGNGPCVETYASGLRNPFRFAIYPGTNRVFANDVGQSTWEEINRIAPGEDYGWNIREGFCVTGSMTECTADPRFADPQFAYDHTTDCRSITGGAFVPTGVWGPPYENRYLFADFTCDSVFRLVPHAGSDPTAVPFFPTDGPVELEFGPSPSGEALYYLEYFTGEVHRVTGPAA